MQILTRRFGLGALAAVAALGAYACSVARSNDDGGALVTGDAAQRVYVAPGKHDEFYAFMSGGFNGQIAAYRLP